MFTLYVVRAHTEGCHLLCTGRHITYTHTQGHAQQAFRIRKMVYIQSSSSVAPTASINAFIAVRTLTKRMRR